MPTYPQVNGLTMLGEAISGGARDYANRRLQLEDEGRRRDQQLQDEARRRGQQLSDIQDTRTYEGERFKTNLDLQAKQDIVLGLVHEGLLAPADLGNETAVSRAFEVARVRGLDKLYNDLLTAPGPDGRPLLSRADLSNPEAIEAAKSAYAQVQASSKKLALDQPQNAVGALGDLTREAAQVRNRLAEVEAKLGEGQPTVNQAEVMNRALQLAREANGGKTPSQQQIQSMVAQAQQEASQLALQRWYQDKEDAKIQYQILNARLNNLRQAQSDLTKTFGVAPPAGLLAEPVAPPPQPARPIEASPEQRQGALTAAIRSAVGQPEAAGPAGPGMQPALPDPIGDPMIQQENNRIAQRNLSAQNQLLADPYNQALDELGQVKAAIAQVRMGEPQNTIPTPGGGMVFQTTSPAQQAKRLSDLMVKQQAVERNLEAKRRLMLGLPAGVTAPTVSDPSSSVPAAYSRPANWWRQGD